MTISTLKPEKKRKALYVGSFDPITNGHVDVITTASQTFDIVYVIVGENRAKQPLFDLDTRLKLVQQVVADLPNAQRIVVRNFSGLTAQIAQELEVDAIIRGIRGPADFASECTNAHYNFELAGLPTFFLLPKPQFEHISSSAVRELHHFGADVSKLVPQVVLKELQNASL
jgi:pantetheine-phosphate adenylyltransferase